MFTAVLFGVVCSILFRCNVCISEMNVDTREVVLCMCEYMLWVAVWIWGGRDGVVFLWFFGLTEIENGVGILCACIFCVFVCGKSYKQLRIKHCALPQLTDIPDTR